MIKDIQELTQKPLLVYFSNPLDYHSLIDDQDTQNLVELFHHFKQKPDVDLLIQTPGGFLDANHKFVITLKQYTSNYRVIVANKVKSGGTVIALGANSIIMGPNSELGPIDPQISVPGYGWVPSGHFINKDFNPESIFSFKKDEALSAISETQRHVTEFLSDGMMSQSTEEEIQRTVDSLSISNTQFHSHGSVIDANEARSLGLRIEYLPQEDELWRKIWLLYSMYCFDTSRDNLSKIFESEIISVRLTSKSPQ